MKRTTLVAALCAALSLGCAGSRGPVSAPICALIGSIAGAGVAGGATAGAGKDGDAIAVASVAGAAALGLVGFAVCRALEARAEAVEEEKPRPPPPVPMREKIVLRGVSFAFGSTEIDEAAGVVLDEAARQLVAAGDVGVRIDGHTDSIGTDAVNQAVSKGRAESVRRYLLERGVAEARLTTAGFGASRPISSNDTREGRALNRRVELLVLER